VSPCKLSEQNFENFTVESRFPKTQKLLTKFSGLATLRSHNYTMITDRRKFTRSASECLVSIIPLASNQSLSLDCTFRPRKVPGQIFGNVLCPILHIKTNTPPSWCGTWRAILKKSTSVGRTSTHADPTSTRRAIYCKYV